MKLIDKDKALKIAEEYGLASGTSLGRHSGVADIIHNQITKLPTIEAEPVRRGQWIENKQPHGGIFDYCFVCSECHKKTPDGAFIISPNYCPFCGTKMDLEETKNG